MALKGRLGTAEYSGGAFTVVFVATRFLRRYRLSSRENLTYRAVRSL